MEDYYTILEISHKASFDEVKIAYRSLCQEYHPDKLPIGTPEKARQYIQERFKQINEAYSILSDLEKRKEYDLSDLYNIDSHQEPIINKEKTIFDSQKMNQVAEKLKELENKIEAEYVNSNMATDLFVIKQLEEIDYKEEDLQGISLPKKKQDIILNILWTFAGLWLTFLGNIFLKIVGILIVISTTAGLFELIFKTSTISKKDYEKIEIIKKKIEEVKKQGERDKQSIKEKRDRELELIVLRQRQRIDFFSNILIQDLPEDYVSELSDKDQFYLLQSIQERKDEEKRRLMLEVIFVGTKTTFDVASDIGHVLKSFKR